MHQPQLKVGSKFRNFLTGFFFRIEMELGDVLFSFELAWYAEMDWLQTLGLFLPQIILLIPQS